MKNFKNQKGIALIVLVIIIIALLILAVVAIRAIKGDEKSLESTESNIGEGQSSKTDEEITDWETATTVATAKISGKPYEANTTITDDFGNTVKIPRGFKIAEDSATSVSGGIVVEDCLQTKTKGSQFVWIPVGTIYTNKEKTTETITLGRYEFDETGKESAFTSTSYAEDTKESHKATYKNAISKDINAFKNSANSNKGYYIGRYEARTVTERSSENDKLTQITERGTDFIYNYVTQLQASNLSQEMYKGQTYTSDLVNSYAWDTAIVFIQKCSVDTNGNKIATAYSRQNSLNTSLATTGTNNLKTKDVQCNIYDMASNTAEWSTETYDTIGVAPCVGRGGAYFGNFLLTCYRSYHNAVNNGTSYSFRPILYL